MIVSRGMQSSFPEKAKSSACLGDAVATRAVSFSVFYKVRVGQVQAIRGKPNALLRYIPRSALGPQHSHAEGKRAGAQIKVK